MCRSGLLCSLLAALIASTSAQSTLLDCLVYGPDGCAEQELSKAIRTAETIPVLRLSREVSIVANQERNDVNVRRDETTIDRLDRYLYGHSLRLELPEELISGARGLLPEAALNSFSRVITVPLAEEDNVEGRGRGILRKVILPFLLGLKFKATAVIPVAIGLIALKTWKAMTLGLLSIVLSAALIIFRLTRPKVLNYEVVYPPHSHHHIVDEHYARSSASDLPYRGYL